MKWATPSSLWSPARTRRAEGFSEDGPSPISAAPDRLQVFGACGRFDGVEDRLKLFALFDLANFWHQIEARLAKLESKQRLDALDEPFAPSAFDADPLRCRYIRPLFLP
jgi:hypothetical protein